MSNYKENVNMTDIMHNVDSVFGDSCEKYVVGMVLYGNKETGTIFYDQELSKEIPSDELTALLLRGAVVKIDDDIHKPVSFGKNVKIINIYYDAVNENLDITI